jgi:class 3 adenylate cyclase
MAELGGSDTGARTYEGELQKQANRLHRLKLQRGAPTFRVIEARARKLFGDKAALPLATQSAIFKGGYVSLDKLMLLVRTLYSWDEYGDECPPPDRKSEVLTEWREQWQIITELRIARRRQARSTESLPARLEGEPAEEGVPAPPMPRRSTVEAMAQTAAAFQQASTNQDRPYRVILFAELAGSTEMKTRVEEQTWLVVLGKFIDITTEAITSQGGAVVKHLGDGTLAAFDGERVTEATNAAIRIQEMLHTESMTGVLEECLASIGIAAGRVVEYQAPGGGPDYVGSVVDVAAQLCSAAAPQAIWVDSATINSANMLKVTSTMGQASGFRPNDYLTREEKVGLQGFPEPVRYREVIWRMRPFGVKSAYPVQGHRRTG